MFRCSQLGNIMTLDSSTKITAKQEERLEYLMSKIKLTEKQAIERDELQMRKDAKPKLGKGARTYLRKLARENKFGITNNIENKYLDKGILCEDEAISIVSSERGWNLVFKNEQRFKTDLLSGEPDVIFEEAQDLGEQGAEIKCSWSFDTHPWDDEKPKSIYYWQCQGYMKLTNRNTWSLHHVLCNTPEHLFQAELERVKWKVRDTQGMLDLPVEIESEIYEELYNKHHFDRMQFKSRIKTFMVERNKEDQELIDTCLQLAKEFYDEVYNSL